MVTMSNVQFEKYKKLIYENLGIYIKYSKKQMIEAKVSKVIQEQNIDSYDEYYNILSSTKNSIYWADFINEITVNKTEFFREYIHFEFIAHKIQFILESNPRIIKNGEIRVWSAGCSTGEEPYTIAMVLKECLPSSIDIKILATDISTKVIKKAQQATYSRDNIQNIDGYYLKKYFQNTDDGFVSLIDDVKKLVTFRTFNLMNTFPFKNSFDIIFCRNVMIYFNLEVQQNLVDKFHRVMTQGGLLFLGHSESFLGKRNDLKYIQPAIYKKLK